MHEWNLEVVYRLLLALVLGSAIGFERALRDKPAGFRTNILICLGSCIFTLASQILSGPMVDKTRIAAQIVTGVGFLGAGAIIRDAKGVVGLTTAATIWAVAAVGMAVGLGEYTLAVAGTISVLAVLLGFPFFGEFIEARRDIEEYRFQAPKTPEQIDHVEEMFAEVKLRIVMNEFHEQADKKIFFVIKAIGPRVAHRKLRRDLLIRDDIRLARATE